MLVEMFAERAVVQGTVVVFAQGQLDGGGRGAAGGAVERVVAGPGRYHHGPQLRAAAGVAALRHAVGRLHHLLQQPRARLHSH